MNTNDNMLLNDSVLNTPIKNKSFDILDSVFKNTNGISLKMNQTRLHTQNLVMKLVTLILKFYKIKLLLVFLLRIHLINLSLILNLISKLASEYAEQKLIDYSK